MDDRWMDGQTDENSVVIQITNYNANYNESSRVNDQL